MDKADVHAVVQFRQLSVCEQRGSLPRSIMPKIVFESLDPEAFEFLKSQVELADGSEPPLYWLCDVVRVLDAVNETASKMKIKHFENGQKYYSFLGGTSLKFRDDLDVSYHIFRLKFSSPSVVCDQKFKFAFRNAAVKGMDFGNTTKF
ncbi:DUF1629 domain-containing protein [Paraburkholderia bryophila]|uniref:imm11 family protein n=1 Tax=Burkholderiaceae TaxID=119060 RepID=UPI0012E00272|nr:DUF1629 domain-containing protein [Burkholderia sp. 9120]